MFTRVKTDEEIEAMREGGKILAAVLQHLSPKVEVGASTKDLAKAAAKELKSLGGQPAFLGYQGFSEVICISLNDEVVHGIPKENNILKSGDVVSLDLGVMYKGMIVDSAITLVCGSSDQTRDNLLRYTKASLEEGLAVIHDGCRVGDIGFAVEKVLAGHGYGIVRDLVGHGVGHAIHEDPNIPNYGRKNTGVTLVAGMTLAIEPMATTGKDAVYTDEDGWTVKTKDGSLAAHFEHTILVTRDGCEILTQ